MKHLFYIHSYITYWVSLEVIKYRGLSSSDCVFMYGRGFKPLEQAEQCKAVGLTYTHHPVKSFSVKRLFWKSWAELIGFDSYVENLTNGKDFMLYTNQTGIDFIRLFITHKNCKGFNLLEEGIISYHPLNKVNNILCPAGYSSIVYKILLLLNYKGRLTLDKWFYDPGYLHAYGVTDFSFPDYERKVILPSPFLNKDSVPDYKNILVLDATAEYGLVTNENILAGLAEGLRFLIRRGEKSIWVKYHPDQILNSHTMQSYRGFFKRYEHEIEVNELPQNLSLEMLAGNRSLKKLDYYVFLSSIGLYAGLAGRIVYSFAPYVAKHDSGYKKVIDSLPDVYSKVVKFITDKTTII